MEKINEDKIIYFLLGMVAGAAALAIYQHKTADKKSLFSKEKVEAAEQRGYDAAHEDIGQLLNLANENRYSVGWVMNQMQAA